MLLSVALATVYCIVRYAIQWDNGLIPATIIGVMMLASLSLTPMIYGPPPRESKIDYELE